MQLTYLIHAPTINSNEGMCLCEFASVVEQIKYHDSDQHIHIVFRFR